MREDNATAEGIGARLNRKKMQDICMSWRFRRRHCHARTTRSGVSSQSCAHARIRAVTKPVGSEHAVFLRSDLSGVKSIRRQIRIPGFKGSDYPPLADDKVRFVGEPIAMCIGATRAAAEDLAERVDLDLEQLAPVVDAVEARAGGALVHDDWGDNLFLTTSFDSGLDAAIAAATVVVRQECRLARESRESARGQGDPRPLGRSRGPAPWSTPRRKNPAHDPHGSGRAS